MTNIDTTTWLPYMNSWYEKYEFLADPYIKLGKLSDSVLSDLLNEIHIENFSALPRASNIDYSGYGLITMDGLMQSWGTRTDPDNQVGLTHNGFIKSVQNIPSLSCNVDAPITYSLLNNFDNIKRAHYAKLGANSKLNVHADNPYQEGLRFQINLSGPEDIIYLFNGTEFSIRPGEIFWLNTGVPHCVINGSQPRISLIVDVAFNGDLTNQISAIKSNLETNQYLTS